MRLLRCFFDLHSFCPSFVFHVDDIALGEGGGSLSDLNADRLDLFVLFLVHLNVNFVNVVQRLLGTPKPRRVRAGLGKFRELLLVTSL